jgi:hypothetical protein
LDGLRRSFVELFPSFEHETAVDAVSICEERPCLCPWLRNCYHLAFRGLQDGIPRVGLDTEYWLGSVQVVGRMWVQRTFPLCPQPMMASVTGLAGVSTWILIVL